jgi:hypothetical protein
VRGQSHIGQQDIDGAVKCFTQGYRFFGGSGGQYIEAMRFQSRAQDEPYGRMVIDEEDRRSSLGGTTWNFLFRHHISHASLLF